MKLSTLSPYASRLDEMVGTGYLLLKGLPVLIRDEWSEKKIGATLEVYTGHYTRANEDGSYDMNMVILSQQYARDFWKLPDQSLSSGEPTEGAYYRVHSIFVDSEVVNIGKVDVREHAPDVANDLVIHDVFALRPLDGPKPGEVSKLPGWASHPPRYVRQAVSIAHWYEGLVAFKGSDVHGQLAAGYLLTLPMTKKEAWNRYRSAALGSLKSELQQPVAAEFPEYPGTDGDKAADMWIHMKLDVHTGEVRIGRSFGQKKLTGPRLDYHPSMGVKVYNGVELKPNVQYSCGPSWDGMTEVRSYSFVDETQRVWMPLDLDYSVRIGRKATYLCHGDRKLANLHQLISEVFPGLDFDKAGSSDEALVDFTSLTEGVAQGNEDDWFLAVAPDQSIKTKMSGRQSRFFDIIVDAHTAFQHAVRAAIK